MESLNKTTWFIGALAVLLIGGGAYYVWDSAPHPLPIAEGDTIESWDFQGSHNDDGEKEQKVRDEIAKLEGMLGGDQSGKEEATDYLLYVGIAGQYQLLGDGKSTYEYLGKALAIDAQKTGLAWQNLGNLMERLGAIHTARIAYARAIEAQPLDPYYVAYLQFLIKYFSEDAPAVNAAIAEAEATFGPAPFLLQLKAAWLEQNERIQDAIDVWKQARESFPEELRAGIDAEVARLQKKL